MKMSFKEFREQCGRHDAATNQKNHFFSSIFAPAVGYLLYRTGFSPNKATMVFGLVGVVAAICLWSGNALVAYLLWRLHVICDMADGNIARATGEYSELAEGYDKSLHTLINTGFLLAALSHTSEPLAGSLILITFQLSYNFSRNFTIKPSSYVNYDSMPKVLAKNFIGLEGFIFFACVGVFFDSSTMVIYTCYVYGFAFMLIFFIKLANVQKKVLSKQNG